MRTLESLKICCRCSFDSTLFANLPNLSELAISLIRFSHESFTKFSSPLRKLSLRQLDIQHYESFDIFIDSIKDTLEELEVKGQFPKDFYECIIEKFPKLEMLKIDLKNAPSNDFFYEKIKPNHNIKRLILEIYGDDGFEKAKGIIGLLPNLTSLRINACVPKDLLNFIKQNLKSIKFLHIALGVNEKYDFGEFHQLQQIYIDGTAPNNIATFDFDLWNQELQNRDISNIDCEEQNYRSESSAFYHNLGIEIHHEDGYEIFDGIRYD